MGASGILTGIEVDIPGDRKRIFKLGWAAQAWLANKHGTVRKVYAKLSGDVDDKCNPIDKSKIAEADQGDLTACQLEAMIDVLYAGFMSDARKDKKPFDRETVYDILDCLGIDGMMALVNQGSAEAMPEPEGESDPTRGQT